jgi:hypothetical protein
MQPGRHAESPTPPTRTCDVWPDVDCDVHRTTAVRRSLHASFTNRRLPTGRLGLPPLSSLPNGHHLHCHRCRLIQAACHLSSRRLPAQLLMSPSMVHVRACSSPRTLKCLAASSACPTPHTSPRVLCPTQGDIPPVCECFSRIMRGTGVPIRARPPK